MFRLLIIFFFLTQVSQAQNLLMNPGFEEENICTEYIKNCAPEGWISTSSKSDYYFDDAPNAHQGQHFTGLIYSTTISRFSNLASISRRFLRSRLLCGLRKGAEYKLEFYVRSAHPFLDSVGVLFTNDDILYRKQFKTDMSPQLLIGNKQIDASSGGWQKVSFTYTAKGTENFIVLADFRQITRVSSSRPDLGSDSYFFLDDFLLTPLNPNERICVQADSIKTEEYDVNERHQMLEKKVYIYSKKPPPVLPSPLTIVSRIDTLVIPDVLFATNSYTLNQNALGLLDSFIFKSSDYQIDSLVIEGHTDSIGPTAKNQILSENRAMSVAAYLQPHYRDQIITRGRASGRPVADNRTPANRQKNRRVEIYIYIRD